MSQALVKDILIKDVIVEDRLRQVDFGVAHLLAENIEEQGLLQPIGVRSDGDSYFLIFGEHRLEAHKILGLDTIESRIYTIDAEEAKLFEMDENLLRVQMLPLETSNALAARKELYEKIHPQTKVGSRGYLNLNLDQDDKDSEDGNLREVPSFVESAIERVGFKKSNIYRLLGLQKIIPHLHVDINSSECDLKNNVSELTALSKINVNDQHSVSHRVLSGECNTIAEASLGGERHIQVENKAQKSVLQIRSGWGRLPVERRADLLDSFAADVLPDGYKIITPRREG